MNKIFEILLQRLAKKYVFFTLYLHYWRGRKGGLRRKGIAESFNNNEETQNETLVAIWDFSFWPYALGDILNWNISMCCQALTLNKKHIDIILIVDPNRPAPKLQSYISTYNYERFLLDVFPAFFTNPMLNNVKIYKDRNEFEQKFIKSTCERVEYTPNFGTYAEAIHLDSTQNKQTTYIGEFKSINAFYANKGYIPKLKGLKGVESIGSNLKLGFPADVFYVTLHLRQRQAEEGTITKAANLMRDVNFDLWLSFINKIGELLPNVRFLLVGRHEEMDRRLFNIKNVIFLKHYGYSLAGELNAIVDSNLFIGSNSGPAMMAMLSDVPYLIFQTVSGQERTARVCEIEVEDKHLIFGHENQQLIWGEQSCETMVAHFSDIYRKLKI